MNTCRGVAVMAVGLLAGCGKTYRPADGSSPPMAVHPVVTKEAPGTRRFLAHGGNLDSADLYYFPDRQLTGVRVESATAEPTSNTNYIHVRLSAADRDRLRQFAAAHSEAAYFGLRFEETPAVRELGGGTRLDAVIVQVFKISQLTDDGRLQFARSMPAEAGLFARWLVGR